MQGADGSFPDWIELENISDEAVELQGWALSDEEAAEGSSSLWVFPDISLEPGAFLLIYADELDSTEAELHASFALSEGETLRLISPDGALADSMECVDTQADCSIARDTEGGISECVWPSPGFENSGAGFAQFAALHPARGPIVINEVAVYTGEDSNDWIELKNISSESVALQDYYLSDDHKDYQRQALPARSLLPGESLLFYCAGDEADEFNDLELSFSLGADREYLFLSHKDSGLCDFVSLHNIPLFGSMGRMSNENGFFYFDTPSPSAANSGGMRYVSAVPTSQSAEGIFEAGESISLELPVISLVLDDLAFFQQTYDYQQKDVYMPSCVAFFDGEGSFKKDCFTSLKGWTSLTLPKKSLGVSFESVLGGELEHDVFNNGITSYSDLSIRAGQDYLSAVIRTELFQELCYEMDSPVLNQESRYSVLYINGQYRGLYCLKEDFSKQYYASHANVSKDSVEHFRAPSGPEIDFFQDVFMYCWHQDMSLPENYEFVCSKVDIDSLIDWFIIEGFSGNTDTQGNLRFFRSFEASNKWVFALYDLDWGFINPYNAYTLLINGGGNVGGEMPTILWGLMNNAEFRDKLLTRFAELNKTVLSNENVLKKIDELAAIVEPEIARDREYWQLDAQKWYEEVEALRRFVIDNNYEQLCIDNLCRSMKLTDEEIAKYFG